MFLNARRKTRFSQSLFDMGTRSRRRHVHCGLQRVSGYLCTRVDQLNRLRYGLGATATGHVLEMNSMQTSVFKVSRRA